MPGVTVGKGCVIGVNSVVTHDIPNYSIAIGSPAKIVGSTKTIDKEFKSHPMAKEFYYEQ